MFCPKCGTQNPDDSKFCAGCGYNMSASAPAPQAPVQAPAEPDAQPVAPQASAAQPAAETEKASIGTAIKSALGDLLDVCKNLYTKAKEFVLSKKLLSLCVAGGVLLVLLVCIIAGIFTAGDGFIRPEYDIYFITDDDEIVLVRDNKLIETNIEGEVDNYAASMDATVVVFLTEDDELYVIDGKKVTKIADDVVNFQINPEASAVLYETDEGDEDPLCLYNVSKKKKTVIAEDADSVFAAAISPNGKSVVYTIYEDDEHKVMYYKDGDTIRIASGDYRSIALTDNGKQIYVVEIGEEMTLYCYNTKGDKEKIISNISGINFNCDYTQALIFSEGKTYISSKGKAAEKISGNQIRPLMMPNVSASTNDHQGSYPVEDLYDLVYTGRDSNDKRCAWFIRKNADKSCKLATNVYNLTYDESGEYLYYIDEDDNLKCLEISDGDRASDKAKILANDVDGFVVTSDRDLVYYISDDILFSANAKNGKSKRAVCSDDVDDVVLSSDDVLFYIVDGDLYATSNGKRGKRVLTDVDYAMQGINCVYFENTEEDIYVSTGSKKVKKLTSAD